MNLELGAKSTSKRFLLKKFIHATIRYTLYRRMDGDDMLKFLLMLFLLHPLFNTLIFSSSSFSLLKLPTLNSTSSNFQSTLHLILMNSKPNHNNNGIAVHERSCFVCSHRPIFLPLECKTHPRLSPIHLHITMYTIYIYIIYTTYRVF